MIVTGGLTCEQSSVTLDGIYHGYNNDLLVLCQLLRKAQLQGMRILKFMIWGNRKNEKYSEPYITNSSLRFTTSAVCV